MNLLVTMSEESLTQLRRLAGAAGMVSGLLLVAEMFCFVQSGWSAEKFAQPEQAMAVLRNGGHWLRMAGAVGAANLAALAVFFAGFALSLARAAPRLALCAFLLGQVGVAAHSLVPVGLWVGVPSLLGARDPQLALVAWPAFNLSSSAAQATGSLFMGAAMTTAGIAMFSPPVSTRLGGTLGLLAGLFTILPAVALGQLGPAAMGLVFQLSLVLTVLFRAVVGGVLFWRADTWRSADVPTAGPGV